MRSIPMLMKRLLPSVLLAAGCAGAPKAPPVPEPATRPSTDSSPKPVTTNVAGPRVHNLAPHFLDYWISVEGKPTETRLAELKTSFLPRFKTFYDYKIERWKSGGKDPDRELMRHLEGFPEIREKFEVKAAEINDRLDETLGTFIGRFPDLDRDFDVWITHSFGEMDGGTRKIGDTVFFILGIDGMVRYHDGFSSEVPFFHHELFHVYHGQYLPEEPVLWVALWAEGLATLAAEELNPSASRADLMLDMPRGQVDAVKKELPRYLDSLRRKLRSTNEKDYETWFLMSSKDKTIVRRAGYVIGYLLAKKIGETMTIEEMARMEPRKILPLLEKEINSMLRSRD